MSVFSLPLTIPLSQKNGSSAVHDENLSCLLGPEFEIEDFEGRVLRARGLKPTLTGHRAATRRHKAKASENLESLHGCVQMTGPARARALKADDMTSTRQLTLVSLFAY